MKKEIKTINKINAPIELIWENLRTGEAVNSWLPIITSCRVEGNKRYCSTEDSILEETILLSDDQNKTFQYSIEKQDLFPVTGLKGTMQLKAIGEYETDLHWDVEFDLQDESIFPQIEEGIRATYAMGAQGLEELVKTKSLI